MNRRDFLRRLACGAGLAIPSVLRGRPPQRTPLLIVWLTGGASFKETFNPDEPDAPAELRGPFASVRTAIPGIRFCELFPALARRNNRFALLRAVNCGSDDHFQAARNLLTCRRTFRAVEWGEKAARGGLPYGLIMLPSVYGVMDSLSPERALRIDWENDRFVPPQMRPDDRLADRRRLLELLDRRDYGAVSAGYERNRDLAFFLSGAGSGALADVFELPECDRWRYGNSRFGDALLLGTRLLGAGSGLVVVYNEEGNGWDMHGNLESRMRPMAADLDAAVGALLDDMEDEALDCTLLLMGEIGRSPQMNGGGGRDHHGKVNCAVLAGKRIRGGAVYGRSDRFGDPADGPVRAPQVLATALAAAGAEALRSETVDAVLR